MSRKSHIPVHIPVTPHDYAGLRLAAAPDKVLASGTSFYPAKPAGEREWEEQMINNKNGALIPVPSFPRAGEYPLWRDGTLVYVPDGRSPEEAWHGTEEIAIVAHPDDGPLGAVRK
jgi:hypothetical protein